MPTPTLPFLLLRGSCPQEIRFSSTLIQRKNRFDLQKIRSDRLGSALDTTRCWGTGSRGAPRAAHLLNLPCPLTCLQRAHRPKSMPALAWPGPGREGWQGAAVLTKRIFRQGARGWCSRRGVSQLTAQGAGLELVFNDNGIGYTTTQSPF